MVKQDLVRFVNEHHLFTQHDRILLAVSGGIDSVVMADLFHKAGYHFGIAHCNFCLRGEESDRDEQFVKQLASGYNVPCYLVKFDTEKEASQSGDSVQMTARRLRYDWFENIRAEHGYDCIATAHHLDDQAETFLINLIRGTGIAGLHGIPVRNGKVVRPMLFAFRRDIEQHAKSGYIQYREDRSNQDVKYLRNKIRHELIPLISSINPDFVDGLTDTIRRLGEFEKTGLHAVEEWQKKHIQIRNDDLVLSVDHLRETGLAPTLAWEFLSRFGFNETQLRNLLGGLAGDVRKVFLSPTHRMIKERGTLTISPITPKATGQIFKVATFSRRKSIRLPFPVVFEKILREGRYEYPASSSIASLDQRKISFPLIIRKWQPGDYFYPLGLRKKKKISDFLIDRKANMREKENTWVLCSGPDIVWIIGQRIDHRFRITSTTKEILRIEALTENM